MTVISGRNRITSACSRQSGMARSTNCSSSRRSDVASARPPRYLQACTSCGTLGRQLGNCGVYGKIEWLINAKGDPRRKPGERTQPEIETRDPHRVHRSEDVDQ